MTFAPKYRIHIKSRQKLLSMLTTVKIPHQIQRDCVLAVHRTRHPMMTRVASRVLTPQSRVGLLITVIVIDLIGLSTSQALPKAFPYSIEQLPSLN